MTQGTRVFATVGAPTDYPKVRHTLGLPMEASSKQVERSASLPWPRAVMIESSQETGVALVRLSSDGSFAGDTWHPNVEQAKEQAAYEFGASLGPWREIPPDVVDAARYAVRHP